MSFGVTVSFSAFLMLSRIALFRLCSFLRLFHAVGYEPMRVREGLLCSFPKVS
jgi:hypothetical protein